MSMPSPEQLRELLRYEPETGKLFWRERNPSHFSITEKRTAEHACANWNSRYANTEAFTAINLKDKGYRSGRVFKRNYLAHRVIWAMQTGYWPRDLIDHKDQDSCNNRWENLREANKSQNAQNAPGHAVSSSRYKGVSFDRRRAKWHARIKVSGSQKFIGYFENEEDAARAYDAASRAHFGEFSFPNFQEKSA
jgi:hypothetical protein